MKETEEVLSSCSYYSTWKKKKINKISKTIQPAGVSSQRFKVCMDYPLEFLNTSFSILLFQLLYINPLPPSPPPWIDARFRIRNICIPSPGGTLLMSRCFPPQLPPFQTSYFSIYFENLHQFSFINERKQAEEDERGSKKSC